MGEENRKTANDVASEVLDVIIAAYPDGVSLADVKEIFNIIVDDFSNIKIEFLDL